MLILFLIFLYSVGYSQTFTNVANQAGVEVVSDYLAIGDINGDMYPDIYIALDNFGNGWAPDMLFLNNGDGTFRDVYDSVGLHRHSFYGHHVTFGDFTNDGFLDLFNGSDTIYINNGMGSFTPYNLSLGINLPVDYVLGSFVFDLNNDGLLDICYDYTPRVGTSKCVILINKGNLIFEKKYLPDFGIPYYEGRLFWTDLNNDVYPDLLVMGDTTTRVYLNNRNSTFSYLTSFGRGVYSFGDINNDGFIDMMVTNRSGLIKLYKNNGNNTFTDITNSAGLDVVVSWGGPNMADFNNDGYLDIYISQNERLDYLFINNKNETFVNIVPDSCYMKGGGYVGILDYDLDGDIDLYVQNSSLTPYNDWKNFLYRNNLSDRYDGTNNWIVLNLRGYKSNASAVGTRVECYSKSDTEYLSQVRYVGMKYVSQAMLPVHFGLGKSQIIDSIVIKWPSGIKQVLRNVTPNQYLNISEDTTLIRVEDDLKREISFSLHQNYPNPFNSKTKIGFTIASTELNSTKGDVITTLKVYDLLGREIATLVNEPKQAGEYEVEFDADKYGLTSGVYLYELRSGSFKMAKKFVLMK